MLKQILLVGLGGAAGSILRFLTGEIVPRFYVSTFPLATFIINIVGCFCIGLFVNLIPVNNSLRFLLITGFCGGFTTFSAFARETFDLMDTNHLPYAIIYTLSSCILGVVAVWLGMYITK